MLEDAGRLQDHHLGGNHHSQLDDHSCSLHAIAVSPCGTMMASADVSGKIVIRFSSTSADDTIKPKKISDTADVAPQHELSQDRQ